MFDFYFPSAGDLLTLAQDWDFTARADSWKKNRDLFEEIVGIDNKELSQLHQSYRSKGGFKATVTIPAGTVIRIDKIVVNAHARHNDVIKVSFTHNGKKIKAEIKPKEAMTMKVATVQLFDHEQATVDSILANFERQFRMQFATISKDVAARNALIEKASASINRYLEAGEISEEYVEPALERIKTLFSQERIDKQVAIDEASAKRQSKKLVIRAIRDLRHWKKQPNPRNDAYITDRIRTNSARLITSLENVLKFYGPKEYKKFLLSPVLNYRELKELVELPEHVKID